MKTYDELKEEQVYRVLLSLKDVDILEISDEGTKSWKGCDTCDWGSSYEISFGIRFSDDSYKVFDFAEMYDYPTSYERVIRTVLGNVEEIRQMTKQEFIEFFEKIPEYAGSDY